jgi:prepilin-type N-terminal cleavage/methylation domain-containing protein
MKHKTNNSKAGFTLIELLVVIAIIAILAVVVFVALDPVTRFADARNSRRWADVNNILTGVHECIVDNDGSLTTCGLTADGVSDVLGTSDLDISTQMAPYLKTMPLDPSWGTTSDTGYSLVVDSNNIVTITADDAEISAAISISR